MTIISLYPSNALYLSSRLPMFSLEKLNFYSFTFLRSDVVVTSGDRRGRRIRRGLDAAPVVDSPVFIREIRCRDKGHILWIYCRIMFNFKLHWPVLLTVINYFYFLNKMIFLNGILFKIAVAKVDRVVIKIVTKLFHSILMTQDGGHF